MHRSIRSLSTILVAGSLIASAYAETQPIRQQLDVALYKDGHQITFGTSIIADEFSGKKPFAFSSGTNIGYGACTKVAGGISLKSENVFVGRAVFIEPVEVTLGKAKLSVSVQDDEFAGRREVGPADCRSESIDTKGLRVEKINVDITDGQPVDVPLGDAHYRLTLKLHGFDL